MFMDKHGVGWFLTRCTSFHETYTEETTVKDIEKFLKECIEFNEHFVATSHKLELTADGIIAMRTFFQKRAWRDQILELSSGE